jgi:hypothetical protein
MEITLDCHFMGRTGTVLKSMRGEWFIEDWYDNVEWRSVDPVTEPEWGPIDE